MGSLLAFAAGAAAVAFASFVRHRLTRPDPALALPGPSPGDVEVRLSYTCHPERLFEQVEHDLRALDPADSVHLVVHIEAAQGWKSVEGGCTLALGPITGRADGVVEVLRALMMDDDSPLTGWIDDSDPTGGSVTTSRSRAGGSAPGPTCAGWTATARCA